MTKPRIANPVPFEGASHDEEIKYLANHIENLNAEIADLKAALVSNEAERHLRGWAAAQAGRIFEDKADVPSLEVLKEYSDWFFNYAYVQVTP